MSDIICVTNRRLCQADFTEQIRRLAEASPKAILLREKDLPELKYRQLAERILPLCGAYGVPCILHTFTDTALFLGAASLHLPLPLLRELNGAKKSCFTQLGASCHSVQEAIEAEALGCTYLIAGHLFATDCKMGVPPRGLSFLNDVCQAVKIPVYAIGGIDETNWPLVASSKAAGGCVMSGAMSCKNPADYLNKLKKAGNVHETEPR